MIENKGLLARQALTIEKSKEVEASIRTAREEANAEPPAVLSIVSSEEKFLTVEEAIARLADC